MQNLSKMMFILLQFHNLLALKIMDDGLFTVMFLTELARLSLMESYCLPVFQYCTSAVYLNVSQLSELNACWNMVYRKIFGFHKWEFVKLFIAGLGRLDLIHKGEWSCLKFCKRVINSTNQVIKTKHVVICICLALNSTNYVVLLVWKLTCLTV